MVLASPSLTYTRVSWLTSKGTMRPETASRSRGIVAAYWRSSTEVLLMRSTPSKMLAMAIVLRSSFTAFRRGDGSHRLTFQEMEYTDVWESLTRSMRRASCWSDDARDDRRDTGGRKR